MGNLLFSPNGRINPSDFTKGIMIIAVISAILTIIPMFSFTLGSVLSIVSLVLLYPLFCLLIKRSHDGGKSGWMSILWLIIFGIIGFALSYLAQMFTIGDLKEQMEAATTAAAESGDLGAIMEAAKEFGPQIAKKTAIPSAIAGLVGSYIGAFVLNKIIGRDDHENQYGPAS